MNADVSTRVKSTLRRKMKAYDFKVGSLSGEGVALFIGAAR
jgi:hypothetical protein